LIVEVGSLGRDLKMPSEKKRSDIIAQLRRYLIVMGKERCRLDKMAVGMCIIGTEYAVIKYRNGAYMKSVGRWNSIYSEGFLKVIEDVAK
jgi:hypothetical protein